MADKYILDADGDPVPEPDLRAWARWFEVSGDQRCVARDQIGDAVISTVFLGLDHSFGSGPALLYETTVFGGGHSDYQDRYATRDDALAGHHRAMRFVSADR